MNIPSLRTLTPLVSFLIIVTFFQAMGGLMGLITAQGVDDWYQTLIRSPFNPPDWAFGVAWTILYFLLSVAFWLLIRVPECKERTFALRFFAFHIVLNWSWSPLFFVAHALFPAFALILTMIFTAAMLAWLIYPLDKRAALAFIPYLGWLMLAGHLSHYIWMKN